MELTEDDINKFNSRTINFVGSIFYEKFLELYTYLQRLSFDTVCILSKRFMCYTLNKEMLLRITADEIKLVAEDSYDGLRYLDLENIVKKELKTNDEDYS